MKLKRVFVLKKYIYLHNIRLTENVYHVFNLFFAGKNNKMQINVCKSNIIYNRSK